MEIDFKELNHIRKSHVRRTNKTYLFHNYSISIFEQPQTSSRSYWSARQNSLIKYLFENNCFQKKNILILFDATGLCSICMSLLDSNVSTIEEKEYWPLMKINMDLNLNINKPNIISLEEISHISYDYIIVSEGLYSYDSLQKLFSLLDTYSTSESKIILAICKRYWSQNKDDIVSKIPHNYYQRQVSAFRSNENVVFELQRKKSSWLESI